MTVLALTRSFLTAQTFGHGPGTRTAAALNQALQRAAQLRQPLVIEDTGGVTLTTTVVVPSGVTVYCFDRITSTAAVAVTLNGAESATWIGGTITGTGTSDTQSAFELGAGAAHNRVEGVTVRGFLNKGFDLKGGAHHNIVERCRVDGAKGSFGTGFSVFGTGANRPDHNVFVDCEATDCARGFSINGGYHNRIVRPSVNGASTYGIGLDGVVTNAGDGASYNVVEGACLLDAGGAAYGAVYLGNGASHNWVAAQTFGGLGAGFRAAISSGPRMVGNVFSACHAEGAALGGFNLSHADRSVLLACSAKGNGQHGLHLFQSDGTQVFGGEFSGNDGTGVLVQADECLVDGITAKGNGGWGVRVTVGGSPNPETCVVRDVFASGNAAGDVSLL